VDVFFLARLSRARYDVNISISDQKKNETAHTVWGFELFFAVTDCNAFEMTEKN